MLVTSDWLGEKKQMKLNDLPARLRIQAHENFSQGPELSFLGRQPKGCARAHVAYGFDWGCPLVTPVWTGLRFIGKGKFRAEVQMPQTNPACPRVGCWRTRESGGSWPMHAEEKFSQESRQDKCPASDSRDDPGSARTLLTITILCP